MNSAMLDSVTRLGLEARDFSDSRHTAIFTAMLDNQADGLESDSVTLCATLERHGKLERVGGHPYLCELADATPAAALAPHYARQVLEASRLRELGTIGRVLTDSAKNSRKSGEVLGVATKALDGVAARGCAVGARRIGDGLAEAAEGDSGDAFIPTGLAPYDRLTGGVGLGELTMIGAWSGHGKSAFVCQAALHAVTLPEPIPAVIFSLEMPERVVKQRILATHAGVSVARLRTGHLTANDRGKVCASVATLRDAPLHVQCEAGGLAAILAEARRLIAREGVKLVVVDYVQLVASGESERRLQLEAVAQALLGLAVGAGVVVLAASQLRKQQAGHSDAPSMHDLRESGALFEAPHVVALVHRQNLGEWEPCDVCRGIGECTVCDGNGGHTLDTTACVDIAKNRSGPCGRVELSWRGESLRFGELERYG